MMFSTDKKHGFSKKPGFYQPGNLGADDFYPPFLLFREKEHS